MSENIVDLVNFLWERIEMSVKAELVALEVQHGEQALPLGRQFTPGEWAILVMGMGYGARHLEQLAMQDAEVKTTLERARRLAGEKNE